MSPHDAQDLHKRQAAALMRSGFTLIDLPRSLPARLQHQNASPHPSGRRSNGCRVQTPKQGHPTDWCCWLFPSVLSECAQSCLPMPLCPLSFDLFFLSSQDRVDFVNDLFTTSTPNRSLSRLRFVLRRLSEVQRDFDRPKRGLGRSGGVVCCLSFSMRELFTREWGE